MVRAGALLGAKTLVTGLYARKGGQIHLLLRALDVETGRIVATSKGIAPVEDWVLMRMLGDYPAASSGQ